jgi:hypothetical protein
VTYGPPYPARLPRQRSLTLETVDRWAGILDIRLAEALCLDELARRRAQAPAADGKDAAGADVWEG